MKYRQRQDRRDKIPRETIKKMQRLRDAGCTCAEVAQVCVVSPSSVKIYTFNKNRVWSKRGRNFLVNKEEADEQS